MEIQKIQENLQQLAYRFFKHKNVKVDIKEKAIDPKDKTRQFTLWLSVGGNTKVKGIVGSLDTDELMVTEHFKILANTLLEWLVIYAIDALKEGKRVKLSEPYSHDLGDVSDQTEDMVKLNDQHKQHIQLLKDYNPFEGTQYVK